MKKFIALVVMCIAVLAIPTHKQYTVTNAAYNNGEIITPLDQNIWWYEDTTIPNNSVVTVTFDDNGTPSYIYDDIIIDITAQHSNL